MPLFPSDDWIKAYCAAFAAHEESGDAAAMLDGVYRFVIRAAGPLITKHVYDIEIRHDDGHAVVDWREAADEGGDPRLVMIADYERWKQLIEGTLDIPLALMLGRLRVKGSIPRLETVRPLLDSLHEVETQWR